MNQTYRPRHKEPMRSDAYLKLEVEDFNVFLAGDRVQLRGRHHVKAADSIIRADEIRERIRRNHLKTLVTAVTRATEMKAAA